MSPAMDNIIKVPNETETSCSRVTKEGRKITYKLRVIQQPEKARACGSGAKSSADRRPVDPPPIIELLIFEGEKADKDITFGMNANYFLFATLEPAKVTAQGKAPPDQKTTVLTGTPVAGLVYLDRPKAAGYFLFPDLSVRHEGHYRLSFNLYEELKEAKDEDESEDKTMPSTTHISHRLELKSRPFKVFSAKRFPGLDKSTQLSRTVAEQGCRVRIRREIRVRKRGKDGKEYDVYEDDAGDMYHHGGERYGHRPRSSSLDSHSSHVNTSSRPGYDNHPQHYQHMGPGHYGMPYGQAYGHSMPYPGHSFPTAVGPPAPYGYAQYNPHSHAVQATTTTRIPTTNAAISPDANVKAMDERASSTIIEPKQQKPAPPAERTMSPVSLVSERGRDTPVCGTPAARRPSDAQKKLPAISTAQSSARAMDASSPSSAGPSPAFSDVSRKGTTFSDSSIRSSTKRTYGDAFDTSTSLYAGRPTAQAMLNLQQALAVDPDDSNDESGPTTMSYRRADGRHISKALRA